VRHLVLITVAAIALTVPAASVAEEGDPVTEAQMPVMAATRIFALENHLHGDIGVADEDEGHIGERFEVNHAVTVDNKLDRCTFTMRRRNGPIIEQISFDRLSAEYKISRRGGYALLQVPGRGSAQCEISGEKVRQCSSSLEMLLMADTSAPTELDLALRALRYIAGVCPPAQLPL
jgi:hypothetical protein